MAGRLYLVPTPIGNLDDITNRARTILETVDVIACEDTRHSGRLLTQLGISKPLIAYHEFNERDRATALTERIAEGQSIAVITDAGSPGISDPAYRIVRAAIDAGLEIVPLPGPCAIIPALTASGLPTDRFFFEGFLSHKSAARQRRLQELAMLPHTLVFYESPHRIVKTLNDALTVLGDRQACVAREITKLHEEFARGPLSDLTEAFGRRAKTRGEIVLVIAGANPDSDRL